MTTIDSLVWVTGFTATATTGGRDTAIAVDFVAVRAVRRHYERVNDNTDDNAGAGNVRSIFTGTDAGTHSSWNTDPFLAFTTATILATSARGFEHGADIVRDGAAYDR